MEMKFAQVVNKGMQRDYAMNTASQEFAYENKNIRITTTGNESFLAITNEKSTVPIEIRAVGLPYRDESREEKIEGEILEGHKLCFINVKQPTEIIVYFTRIIYYLDSSPKLEQGIPHKVLVTPGVEEETEYGTKILVTYTDITESFDELLNVEGAKEVHILPDFYFNTFSGYVPIGENVAYYSNFFNKATIYGSTMCGEYLVLFTKAYGSDFIFRAKIDNLTAQVNTIYCELVYSGSLDFNYNMEFTTYYESDDVQKVYWVDGKNQPRVINICKLYQTSYTTNLDFIPKINSDIKVSVEKQYEGRGVFPSGVIQYYVTYYNKFGQESNAVHVTPLYSLSPSDRGGAEDETQTCSFKIRIENVDRHYTNIRIYSLIRTSLNTIPVVSIVGDLNINESQYYEIIDDNYGNINVPSSDILFLGGNTISASTIEQKDNTLFLGNISSIANNDDYTELKKVLENNRIDGKDDGLTFISRPIESKQISNVDYGYAPNMDLSSKDKGFKYLEYYRFGLQFQNDTGEWGNTLWLNDKQNHLRPDIIEYDEHEDTIIQEMYNKIDNFHSLAAIKYKPSEEVKKIISKYNSKYYRLVMAEHNNLSRTIKTQGIVMPTLFNLKQKADNLNCGSPVWNTGILRNGLYHYDNIDLLTYNVDIDNDNNYYLDIHPAQQLDASLYEIKDGYPDEDGSTVKDSKGEYLHRASFKILPSATISNAEYKNGEYLTYLEIEIEVYRVNPVSLALDGKPGTFTHEDYMAALFSPRGNVVQDMFFFRIIPYTKDNDDNNKINKKPTYTLREFRLAGKVENTVDILITQMAGKKWKDYKTDKEVNDAAKGVNLDFIGSSVPIINTAEIISAHQFNEERKKSDTRPNYIYRNKLNRSGNLDHTLYLKEEFKNQYFINANICNLWSPNISEINDSNSEFRIVGTLDINNTISDYEILTEGNIIGGTTYTPYEHSFNKYNFYDVKTGITSYPLWPGISTRSMYWMFLWNQNIILNHNSQSEGDKPFKVSLKNKTFANLWKTNTEYLENPLNYGNIEYKMYNGNSIYYKGSLYDGKPQNLLFPKTNRRPYLYSEDGLTITTDFNTIEELIEKNNTFLVSAKESVNSSVNIKYSSTDHLMFSLGDDNGFMKVLPSYEVIMNVDKETNYGGTIDVTTNINYPVDLDTVEYKLDIYGYIQEDKEELYNIINPLVDTGQTFVVEGIIYDDSTVTMFNIVSVNDINLNLDMFFDIVGLGNKEPFRIPTPEEFKNLQHYNILLDEYLLKAKTVTTITTNHYKIEFEVLNAINLFFKGCASDVINYIGNDKKLHIISSNKLSITTPIKNHNITSKLFLGEFYIPYDPSTFMGGNTENALELNTFIPISEPTPIGETIYGFEGDTYYQQWDCLRIYPTSEEDVNKVVDVVSAMIETTVNLDGDTRKARGRSDMINVRPDNMVNQINPVYSQSNNYVTSKILDEKSEDSTHPLQYWWSLTKTPNADIDTWTGVNLTSVAELDGDKGSLNKIKRWNNQLFAFQDKAIAMINYNNQTTIATQEGLPVEISNSGKVQGHYYLTTNNGCSNKDSIVESPNGLYFIDGYNTSINVIGEGIKSLSQLNLFQDWIEQVEKDPYRLANNLKFKGFYDPIHKEIYYSDGIDCICYNELLQQFTSFYDYQTMRNMFAANGHVYAITSKNKMYKMFEGDDYCKLFDTQCDYYMQYKINNEPFIDKTWTNLEYRADIFDRGNIQTNEFDTNDIVNNETFDLLKVWNEYQNGELDLTKVRFGYLKEAKPKFRIWRTNLPRAKSTTSNKFGLDRIRNPWIMLELKKTGDTSKRMEFHDLIIKYVI